RAKDPRDNARSTLERRSHAALFSPHTIENSRPKLPIERSEEVEGFAVFVGDGRVSRKDRNDKVGEVSKFARVAVVVETGSFEDNIIIPVTQPFQQRAEIIYRNHLRRRKMARLVANHIDELIICCRYQTATTRLRRIDCLSSGELTYGIIVLFYGLTQMHSRRERTRQ